MFEKLLERILERILGQYVDGLSKDQMKIGIWSGNVDISNLRLKQSIIQQMDLPFQLRFGMIENLKMKIPWKNLSTSSIQIQIQGIYLLISPTNQATWKELEHDVIENKQNFYINYAKTMIDTITEKLKLKGKEADKGYFGKLIEKIIDNLSISIKDIHIRLESVTEPIENLSFGFTLDSLSIQTCDENWKPTFLDIDNSDALKKTVFKSLEIKNFYIYWNSEETLFLSEKCKDQNDYFLMMKSLIYNDKTSTTPEIQRISYLFNFSTIAHMKQIKKTKATIAEGIPEFDIEIQLDTCNFNLTQSQIKQSSKIINVVNEFSDFLCIKEKIYQNYKYRPMEKIENCADSRSRSNCTKKWWKYLYRSVTVSNSHKSGKLSWFCLLPKKRTELRKTFNTLFQKLVFTKEIDPTSVLTSDELLIWENIICIFDKTQILQWIDEDLKTQKIQEQIQKEQNKKTGFLGLWGKTKEVTEDDERKLEELLDQIIKQQDITLEVPDDYPKIKVKFIQRRFNILLSKRDLIESSKEEVLLQTKDIQMDLFIKKNGMKVLTSMKGIKLSYKRKDFVDKITYDEQLFFCEKAGESFFSLMLEDKPSAYPGLDKLIEVNLGSINIIYNSRMIQSVSDLFKLEISEEATEKIRLKAKKKFREAKDIGEHAMRDFLKDQPKFIIKIYMKTPQIILPIDNNQLQNSACWIFYPGDLSIHGDTFSAGNMKEMYDNFSVSLTDIQFVYCKKVQYVLAKNISIDQMRSQEVDYFFYIFKDFNIDVKIKILKKIFVELNILDARISVSAKLNALNLNLTPEMIHELKNIGNIFMIEERSLKKREKREIITGALKSNYLEMKIDNQVTLYFSVFYKNAIYFFENPKDEEKAKIIIDLEEIPVFLFVNSETQLKIKTLKSDYIVLFNEERMYNSWKKIIETAVSKIKARLFSDELLTSEQYTSQKTNLEPILANEAKTFDENVVNVKLDFLFDNLKVAITQNKSVYILNTESLSLKLVQTEVSMKCKVELQKFSLSCNENTQEKYIFSSFYSKSLASQIMKDSYVQKQEQLLIINYEQSSQSDLQVNCKKINILFGSLFVDFEPVLLSKLLRIVSTPSSQTSVNVNLDDSSDMSLIIEDQAELGAKTLEIYEQSDKKMNKIEESPVEIELSLEIQAINLLLINGIKQNPLANIICQDSSCKLLMRKGAMEFNAEFFDLRMTDLTNFPNTLKFRDIEKIVPSQFFGKYKNELREPLVSVKYTSKDPQLFNIDDKFIANTVDIKINNVKIVGCLQPLMRISGFMTDQLLPSLSGELNFDRNTQLHVLISTNINENVAQIGANKNISPSQIHHKENENNFIARRKAYIAVHKPFWMKMDVSITHTEFKLPINDKSHIIAYIENLTVQNNRLFNESRICRPMAHDAIDRLTGIWNDEYQVNISKMGLDLCQTGKSNQTLTSPMNLYINAQLPLFQDEYEILYKPGKISNYQNRHLETSISDATCAKISPGQVIYDNAMIVTTHLTPFIFRIGNFEYLSLMKCLETCVSFNDGLDEIFVKDFVHKEQSKKPSAMVVFTKIDRIALVSLNNKKNNEVSAKVFFNDFNFTMVTHPNGDSAMSLRIQDLRGYHLLQFNNQYHEKGFIGELWVTKTHKPKDLEELSELFLKDIYEDGLNKPQITSSNKNPLNIELNMETTSTQKSIQIKILKLIVLLQTDVLMELLGLIEQKEIESSIHRKTSTANQNTKANVKKEIPMVVTVELAENSFLLPSADSEVVLVMRSNVALIYRTNPQKNEVVSMKQDLFKSTIQEISRREVNVDELLKEDKNEQIDLRQNEKMSVILNLNDFEMFMIKFIDFFREESSPASKRELILPFSTELLFHQYYLQKEAINQFVDYESVNINKISLYIAKEIEVKFTVLDIELLLGIMNYQLALRGKNSEQTSDKKVEAIAPSEDPQITLANPYLSYNYVVVKIQELKITLINENSNIFAPIIIFKLKSFEFFGDLEEMTKVSIGFGLESYYFNSEIFRWEPFIETAKLLFEYETMLKEGGVMGKVIKIQNDNEDKKMNINVSIAFLIKIKFLLDTWENMKIKNIEEAEKVKNVKMENYLRSIQSDVIIETLKRAQDEVMNNPNSYISPIRITNTTGYPITVKYYKKVINVKKGTPVLKSMNEKFVELQQGESKPLNADESIEDYEDVNDKLRTNLSYKFISIQIQHPEFTINKIDNINVVINHSKKINLKGREKNLGDYKIIYSSRTNVDIKEIMISSPMMFVNNLDEKIKIIINHPFGKRSFEINPGEDVFIPFDLISYLFDIFVGSKKMVFKGKFESFYLKQTGHFLVLISEDKSINFVLKVYQEVKFRYLAKLVAIQGISFANNLPMPISITMANQTSNTKKIDLLKEGSVKFSDFDIGTNLKISLTVPGFKPTDFITLIEMNKEKKEYKFTYPKLIKLIDIDGRDTFINLVRVRDGYSHFFYSFFCSVVIVNETPYPIICNASEKFKMPKIQIGGQTNYNNTPGYEEKIVLIGGSRTFINLCLENDVNLTSTQYSNTISTQGITSGVLQLPMKAKEQTGGDMFLEFGYTMRLFYLDQNDVTASKVIQITPKTILYNHSEYELKIESDDLSLTELGPEQKMPLFLFKKLQKSQKMIVFSVRHNGEFYKIFTPLDLNKVGTAIFLLSNETKTAFRIFKVEITLQVDYLFVTFSDRTGCQDLYILNHTEYDLIFNQLDNKKRFDMYLKSGECVEFGLVDPYLNKVIQVAVNSKNDHLELGNFAVKLHKLTKELISFKNPKRFNLFANLELKDGTRHLTITSAPIDAIQEAENKKQKDTVELERSILKSHQSEFTTLDFKIQELGISIIARYLNQNVELFYIYMSGIRLVAIIAEDQQEIQFVIKYLNIDSNYSTNCKYPVLLTVSKSQESLKETNFFNFHVILNNTKNTTLYNIDLFEFEIIPITFTAEFSLIDVILSFKKQMDKIFSSKQSSDYLGKYFKNTDLSLTQSFINYQNVFEWQTIQFNISNTWIYCREFKMSLIKIMMTFNMTNYTSSENKDTAEELNVDLLIETFGVTFLNIDESPISFSGLKLESIFESTDAFTNMVMNHLKNQKNLNIAKLVGSLDIIGNPVSLFSNLSNGVVEFFEKPVSGFVRGPIEGFYGIADGSKSLIKNTAAGTFNTISKITNSLASGLTALSMDKEYLNKRNITRAKKPQNLIDGMGKGVISIGKGFFSGITGIVSQPIHEVKKSGATGIFIGVFKGLSGLITKPLGGVMDATSQTAEGLKKSVTNFDDRANERKMRAPRVFYSSLQYFKVYNPDDSSTMKILKTLEGGRYENDTFFDTIEVIVQEDKQKHFIVLTNENFLILKNDKTVVVLRIEVRDISRMKYIDENNMAIEYYVNGEKKVIQLHNQKENIYKIINTVNYCKYMNHVDSI